MSHAGAADRIVKGAEAEQRRLSADSLFAVTAILRGKSYELHDARSEFVSRDQLRVLRETSLSLELTLDSDIAELEKALFAHCAPSCQQWGEFDANAVGAANCRAAFVVAVSLARRFRTAFDAAEAILSYSGMRIEALDKKWEQMYTAMTELESHAAEIAADNLRRRDELRTVNAENDALKKRLRACSDMLGKGNGIRPPRNGKKMLDPVTDLERSVADALSQFEATKKKCDALTKDLSDAKRALARAEKELSDVAQLNVRLLETSEQCAAKDDKIEALETKLRCSICEERDKDTAFACGHTFCSDCAIACAKCPLRCESERRRKPVKHTFRIYF